MSGFDPTCYILLVIVVIAFTIGHLHHHQQQAMLHAIAVSSVTFPPKPVHSPTVNQAESQEEKAYEFQEHFFDWVDNSDFLTFNDDF